MSFKTHTFISKLLCIALALLMLVGGLVSCSKEDDKNKPDATPNTQAPSDDANSPKDEKPTPYMDNFGNYVFRILGPNNSTAIVGDMMGDAIEQAEFSRTDAAETKYGFVVELIKNGSPTTAATNSASAGNDDYDMFLSTLMDTVELGLSGYLYDLNTVEWMNLDASYYSQEARKQASFAHKLFFATGSMLTHDNSNIACIFFSHDIWKNLQLDEVYGKHLYDIILDGEWTVDVMEEFAKRATYDLNGDDVMDGNDAWGYHHSNGDITALNVAFGNDLIMKNEDDIFVLNTSAKQQEDLQRIIRFFNTDYCVGHSYKQSVFRKFRQLFGLHLVGDAMLMKSEGINYGYAPYPKANVEQKEYRSWMNTYSTGINIFITVSDVNKSASIIDLLSYESMDILDPAIIEYLTVGRPVNRPEDAEVLKLMFKNTTFDLAFLWRGTGAYELVCELNNKVSTDVASTLRGAEDKIAAEVQRMLNLMENKQQQ